MDWLSLAKTLPIGGRTRVKHECGSGAALSIYSDVEGWGAYCHRCDFKPFHRRGELTLAEIRALRDLNKQQIDTNAQTLPNDFTNELPVEAVVWLARGGLRNSQIRRYNIGYSKRLHRCILPVYHNGDLVYWQARALSPGQEPKYLNPDVSKSTFVAVFGGEHSAGRILCCEDILSSIRVAQLVRTLCLLGTKTTDNISGYLSQYPRVTYWLDPDEAGVNGSRKGVARMGLVTATDSICTSVDPKNMSDRAIAETLEIYWKPRYL